MLRGLKPNTRTDDDERLIQLNKHVGERRSHIQMLKQSIEEQRQEQIQLEAMLSEQ